MNTNKNRLFQILIILLLITSCSAPNEPELGPAPAFCQPGQGLIENGEGCDVCPPGTFNDASGSVECQVCPPGTYQDEEGATECKPCPPAPGTDDEMTPEPIPAACQAGIDIGAPPPVPAVVTQADNNPTEENIPDSRTTATPVPLTGIWSHESSPGQLDCAGFSKTIDAMFGTVEVEIIEDGARMIMRGVPDYEELYLDRIDETTYRAVLQVEDGVVTVTVYVRSPILMEGEILGQYTGGCEFKRTFQLNKQG